MNFTGLSALALGVWLAAGQGVPQSAAPPRPAPAPAVVEPAERDFGVVPPGSTQQASFSIRNIGPAALRVAQVTPSCKCTNINLPLGSTIQPGGELEFSASLAVPKNPGEKDAKVFIVFDGYPAPLIARMKADARLPVFATPSFVDALKGVTAGEVTVGSRDGTPFQILSAGGHPPDFASPPAGPQSTYTLRWSIPAPAAGQTLPLWWVVETDRADAPLIALRIRHETTGVRADPTKDSRFWFFPEPLVVAGDVAAGEPVELEVEIEHTNTKGRGKVERPDWGQVKAVRSLSPLATVALVSVREAGATEAEVRFSFTLAPEAAGKGALLLGVEVETATGRGSFPVAVRCPTAGAS